TQGDGPANPTGGEGMHASPRVSRRARRHAEKEAARATGNAETPAAPLDPSSLGADALKPLLAPAERRLLSRLTANRLAEV
ncbi:MAG: hypothetical protein ABIP03_08780, partial [Aquihabitans sp.]